MARQLIIDCDPGVDDALALFLALKSPALEVLAVTAVAGNVAVDHTARNARVLVEMAGRGEVPVFAGCDRPLVRESVEAGEFHGAAGLGDWPARVPERRAEAAHAAVAIVDMVMARPAGTVDLAILGPMTNVAMALRLEPKLAGRLGRVAVMGGARAAGGNITASAEYNIHADPHAAAIVLGSGAEVAVFGLDVTHTVRVTAERLAAIAAIDTPLARAAAELLDFANRAQARATGEPSSPLHDPCPIAWLIDPSLFALRPARMAVETASPLTLGHTAVELRLGDGPPPPTTWSVSADADGVFALLDRALARGRTE